MKKSTKIWLIVAASLFISGAAIFVGGMSMLKWNFSKLSNIKYETHTYQIEDDFADIYISTDTADVTFKKSETGKCYVECDEAEKLHYSVEVRGNSLEIKLIDTRRWYNYISIFNDGANKVTLYLTESQYNTVKVANHTGRVTLPDNFTFGNIDVKLSTGHIKCYASVTGDIKLHATTGSIFVSGVTAHGMDLKVSTGDVHISNASVERSIYLKVTTGDTIFENVSCNSFKSEGDTGSFTANHFTAKDKVEIERSTGDITIDYLGSDNIDIETDTGKVHLALAKKMAVYADTATGKVDIQDDPMCESSGVCNIETDTGNIKVIFYKSVE